MTYLNSNWRFDSEIVGEGLIRAGCRAVATTNARGGLVLTANNANFHGKVEVAYDPDVDGKNTARTLDYEKEHPYLIVTRCEALGGPLASFTPDALKIKNYGMFWVTNSLVFDTANRGVTVSALGRVNVTNAADTLVFANAVTYAGTLRKEGAGTLAFGARPKFLDGVSQDLPLAGTNLLVVKQGAVKPLSTEAFTSLAITFSNNTTIAVNAVGDDADLLAKGLVSTGSLAQVTWPEAAASVNVRLDGVPVYDMSGRATLGVITLPTQAAAQTALGKLRAGCVVGANVALRMADAANADGTWTVRAGIRKRGAGIIFR